MTYFTSLISSHPYDGGAIIMPPRKKRRQIREEPYSKEQQGGEWLLVSFPHQKPLPQGPGLASSPITHKKIEGRKDLLGEHLLSLLVSFVASTKASHTSMEPQSKTSLWTVQSKAPWDPRPHGTDIHTLWSDLPLLWKEGAWGVVRQQGGGRWCLWGTHGELDGW